MEPSAHDDHVFTDIGEPQVRQFSHGRRTREFQERFQLAMQLLAREDLFAVNAGDIRYVVGSAGRKYQHIGFFTAHRFKGDRGAVFHFDAGLFHLD